MDGKNNMDDNKINYYAIYFDDCLYDTGSYEYCQDCKVEIKKQCQDMGIKVTDDDFRIEIKTL